MTNTLYLPELREMLAEQNSSELAEFCTALHPARTAEFMEGLSAAEAWQVLTHADPATRVEIFRYFDHARQVEIVETVDRESIGQLIAQMAADERVDILHDVSPAVVDELLPLLPTDERRDILRLRAYPQGTAGALMTTQFARLSEDLTVNEALEELRRQVEELETIYYLYVVDAEDHLRGLVSLRQLVLAKPQVKIADLMQRGLVTVPVTADQEEVARTLARFDFLAIPIVDNERHLVGIVTHDDVIDVVREEATEDAQRIGAVVPLRRGYLETSLWTITWKRAMWLLVLFVGALSTAYALQSFSKEIQAIPWLVLFLPLVISTGGNSGSQSATLIITALSTGDVSLADWWQVVRRELLTGIMLGTMLGPIGYLVAATLAPDLRAALVVPLTIVLVVTSGTLLGSILPLVFRRFGLDPALMSNPFVACLSDIVGIVVYMTVALRLLGT